MGWASLNTCGNFAKTSFMTGHGFCYNENQYMCFAWQIGQAMEEDLVVGRVKWLNCAKGLQEVMVVNDWKRGKKVKQTEEWTTEYFVWTCVRACACVWTYVCVLYSVVYNTRVTQRSRVSSIALSSGSRVLSAGPHFVVWPRILYSGQRCDIILTTNTLIERSARRMNCSSHTCPRPFSRFQKPQIVEND